jgi:pyruvate dehydrogenase E2 component (dihydrolipoamide acetyltransferase)
MPDVNMPKLSDTMEEGTVLDWKKSDGDEVKKGDVLAEIESDKASFEIEAEADGVLHIVTEKGAAAPVGAQIATIGGEAAKARKPAKAKADAEPAEDEAESAEDEAEPAPAKAEKKTDKKGAEAPDKADAPEEAEAEDEDEAGTEEPQKVTSTGREPAREEPPEERGEAHIKASPIAARLAAEMGVDLRDIEGSGPDGRIVKEDVLKAAEHAGWRILRVCHDLQDIPRVALLRR